MYMSMLKSLHLCFSRLRTSSASPRRIYSCKMNTIASPNFIPLEDLNFNSPSKPHGFLFRVVSYNILAQAYVKSALFPHSPSPCLRWKARSKAILTVLKNLGADILCLQELDEYDDFFKGNMEREGYSSIYVKRNGQKRDGCGIFYKPKIADLILDEKIEYNDLIKSIEDMVDLCDGIKDKVALCDDAPVGRIKDAESTSDLTPKEIPGDRGDINDPRIRLKRDCVGIMAAFRLSDPSHHTVIVANTHLYWDPELADVKLAQAKYLLSRLAQFKTLVSDKYDCTPSVIITGDFNSIPGDKVYKYLTSGCSSSMPLVEEDPVLMCICSVYGHTRGEPSFTNCTPGFTNTLDYIFVSPDDKIKAASLLELPGVDNFDVVGGLPNEYHPSDHLPVGAEFEVINT